MQGLYSFSYHSHALQADHSLFDSDDHRTQSQFEQSISISDFWSPQSLGQPEKFANKINSDNF